MTRVAVIVLILLSVCLHTKVGAQCSNGNVSLGGYSCNPITQFTTQAQMLAGATNTNCVHLAFNLNNANCSNWTLKVRTTTATFANGANGIPVQYVSLKYNSNTGGPNVTNYSGSPVALSTTDQVLVSNANGTLASPPYYYFEHLFNAIIQGGSHLYQPVNGSFNTTLVFSLYNSNNQLVSTANISFGFQIQYQGPNLFDQCQGMSLNGNINNPMASFNTYAQLMSGITTNEAVTVSYGLVNNSTNCPGWSLKVRATSAYFTNSGNNIPVGNVSLRFNSVTGGPSANDIGVSYNPVQLSTSERALITHSNARLTAPPHGNVYHKFDVIVAGGSHMIQPVSGAFTVNLVFSLYDWNDQFVASWNTAANIQIYFNANSLYSMTLQNGANSASFDFTTLAQYTNGISLTKTNGLKITGYQNYQVFAQTTSADLVSANTTQTLPASIIKLQASLASPITGVTCNTVSLSPNNQSPLIINTNPNYPYQTVQYNLRYYIEGNIPNFFTVPADAYTGTLVLVVVPY